MQSHSALLGESPSDAYHKPSEQAKDENLEFELREQAGRAMAANDANIRRLQANLQKEGYFRVYVGREDGMRRGDRPTYSAKVHQVDKIVGNRVTDTEGE
eukprot:595517-Alexandrium_andersonii.AAC.1